MAIPGHNSLPRGLLYIPAMPGQPSITASFSDNLALPGRTYPGGRLLLARHPRGHVGCAFFPARGGVMGGVCYPAGETTKFRVGVSGENLRVVWRRRLERACGEAVFDGDCGKGAVMKWNLAAVAGKNLR